MIKVTSGSIIAGVAVIGAIYVFSRGGLLSGVFSKLGESFDVANDRNLINRAFNYVYTGAGVLRDPDTTSLGGDIFDAQVFLESDRNPLKPVGQAIGTFLFKLFN